MKGIIALMTVGTLINPMNFTGRTSKDVFPLHKTLNYKYINQEGIKTPINLIGNIIKDLDVENNPRYKKVGVVYKNNKAYEIPLHEIRDFNINSKHTNTYCNIFTIDVLNIMDNTLMTNKYKVSEAPVLANNLRTILENSKEWKEISKSQAGEVAKEGNVVILSYVKNPHGHVAFVKPESTSSDIYLWNVGATNGNNVKWHTDRNTKYFKKVKQYD